MSLVHHITPFGVRMPDALKDWLKQSSIRNKRSLNAEINARLEECQRIETDINREDLSCSSTGKLPLMRRAFSPPSTEQDDAIIEVTHSTQAAELRAKDLIRVDFTKNTIFCDGLYILTYGGNNPDWVGIRRVQIVPGAIRIYENLPDLPYREISRKDLGDMRVVGWVKEVYKKSYS